MPTWDEITPDTERSTRSLRLTATNAVIGINIIGFLFSGILPGVFGIRIAPVFAFDVHRAIGDLWLWQFLTYSLIQQVDIWFMIWFIFHAYILYLFGNELEQELGRRGFLTLYLSCAAYGAMAHALYQVIAGSHVVALSFFGPVFGVVVAYALRHPSRPILFFFVIPMKLMTAVLISGAILLFYCIVTFKSGNSPTWTILGAGVSAAVIYKVSPLLERWFELREVRSERSRTLETIELRREVDRILEKISHEGMGALTRAERQTLKRASQSMGPPGGRPD